MNEYNNYSDVSKQLITLCIGQKEDLQKLSYFNKTLILAHKAASPNAKYHIQVMELQIKIFLDWLKSSRGNDI